MSRKTALVLLGFKENDNPLYQEISLAASKKIAALKNQENTTKKVDAILAIYEAEKKLKKNLEKTYETSSPAPSQMQSSKPKKIKMSWFLWAGIPFTLATAISTFCSAYWLAPTLGGLSKLASAFAITGIATSGAALFFGALYISVALLNFIATRKYDKILDNGKNISHTMLDALDLGLKSKNWDVYFECFTKGVTYQYPLAYRAAIVYATTHNQTKVSEIEDFPTLRLNKQPTV